MVIVKKNKLSLGAVIGRRPHNCHHKTASKYHFTGKLAILVVRWCRACGAFKGPFDNRWKRVKR